ncbi:MAG: zinc ribbon domain-containing protein [Labilithrix sp.]|nr:zinc ribbon domain-containing protein [Labilithrix sp.]
MRCGVCGGSMAILARKTKAGVSYAQFGCVAHYSRGATICANNMTISELKVTKALLGALKDTLGHPEFIERFREQAQRRIGAAGKKGTQSDPEIDRRIRESERRIANLTDSLGKLGWSDAIGAKLKEEEGLLGRLKAERAKLKPEAPPPLPHPKVLVDGLTHLMAVLKSDPMRGRDVLSRFVSPLVMTPEGENPDRSYRATGAFDLSFFLDPPRAESLKTGVARVGFEPTTFGL